MKAICCLAIMAVSATTNIAVADSFGSGANSFDIEFVRIGNPGNPADTTGTPNPAGSVARSFRVGKYEVSTQMLDKANVLGSLGITRFSYGANKPVVNVSWNEAARFINWLNVSTGHSPAYKFAIQPGESGYSANLDIELWIPGDAGYRASNPYRNRRARYFLPGADEWYKAAYYDPTSGDYYKYPTGSDDAPDGIDFDGDSVFDALFYEGWGEINDITNVGVLSPYGTAGQGGSVREWEETDLFQLHQSGSSNRGIRGAVLLTSSATCPLRLETTGRHLDRTI